ncbi:MAG: hypothetical protein U9R15_06465, partial [Chloroflexota bacterium]|nr:hypothetical protein [Chloroflexota bacterium]
IQRRMGSADNQHELEGRRTLLAFAKSGLASLAMGAALVGWRAALPHAGALVVGGGGVLLGAAVYVAAALLLRVEVWAGYRP